MHVSNYVYGNVNYLGMVMLYSYQTLVILSEVSYGSDYKLD